MTIKWLPIVMMRAFVFVYIVFAYKSLKIPKGNQNPYIEEEQKTQWPKEKEQKDKQRSTKHAYKTNIE